MRKLLFGVLIITAILVPVLNMKLVSAQVPNNVEILDPVCYDDQGNELPGEKLPEICKRGQNHSDSLDDKSPLTGKDGILSKAMDILALIVGIACVLVIMISGLRFIVSAGDSNAISSARRSLIYAIVGLLIVVAARILVRFVLSRL